MIHGLDTSFLIAIEVSSHADHSAARAKIQKMRRAGDRFAITPLVIAEFIHVVTDSKRHEIPLEIEAALSRAEAWLSSPEIVYLTPGLDAHRVFLDWMRRFRLGRKRILDTQLAATFHALNVQSILTCNPNDFSTFGCFQIETP